MFAAGTVVVALLAAVRGSLLLAVQAATSTGATEGLRPPAPAFAFPARRFPPRGGATSPAPPCAALVRGNAHRRRRPPRVVRFASTVDGSGRASPPPPPTTDVVERHELGEQFGRWRFLQRLLEGEVAARDVEDVLLLSLCAYLEHGPLVSSSENKDENGGNASPVLTPRQRSEVEYVLHSMSSAASDGIGDSRVLHMLVSHPVDYESSSIDGDDAESDYEAVVEVDGIALSMLERIERLLPDPVEDEEAHKSAWDVVMDLHGRESVRVSEESLRREGERGGGGLRIRARSLQWRTLCSVGRMLIHFDFLTKGVLKEGTFTSNNR